VYAHLLCVYAVILHFEHCVLDVVDFKTLCENMAGVSVSVYDDLHLFRFDLLHRQSDASLYDCVPRSPFMNRLKFNQVRTVKFGE
jgi:hypothetical protein